MPKRVLLKISGEMLGSDTHIVQKAQLESLSTAFQNIQSKGIQLGVVVGGGNIWRGRDTEDLGLFRGASDHIGMLATVMNALILAEFLRTKKIPSQVFSMNAMPRFCEEYSISKGRSSLEEGNVAFFASGTGAPYFTTDSAAALKAIELECDFLAKATTVDGVYDDDPRKNPEAKKYETLSFREAIQKNLKVMDQTAFSLCLENGMKVRVFDGLRSGNIEKVVCGEGIGTLVC